MKVVLDRLIVTSAPGLVPAIGRAAPEVQLAVFDSFAAPASLERILSDAVPTVIAVDRMWLYLCPLLRRLVARGGRDDVRIALAVHGVDRVVRVQSAHCGFSDIVDLDDDLRDVARRLARLRSSPSPIADEGSWSTVPDLDAMPQLEGLTADDLDREILDLVCVGMRDADIAEVVHASLQSVKNRISAMLRRAGLRNRTQLAWICANDAIASAVARGLDVSPSPVAAPFPVAAPSPVAASV